MHPRTPQLLSSDPATPHRNTLRDTALWYVRVVLRRAALRLLTAACRRFFFSSRDSGLWSTW